MRVLILNCAKIQVSRRESQNVNKTSSKNSRLCFGPWTNSSASSGRSVSFSKHSYSFDMISFSFDSMGFFVQFVQIFR